MSRSRRKPFHFYVCCGPVKPDRQLAARGVRRKSNREISIAAKYGEFDDFLVPGKYECPHNDRWIWNCDGSAVYQSDRPHRYHLTWIGIYLNSNLDIEERRTQPNRYWLNYHVECIRRDKEIHELLKRK